MLIDIHAHCFEHHGYPRDWKGTDFPTPDELLQKMETLGIDKTILLPLTSPEGRYRIQSPDEILRIAQKYPDKFIPFCNIDPRMLKFSPETDYTDIFAYYDDLGCKGMGEITINIPFDDPMMENFWKGCQMFNWPVIFHLSYQRDHVYGLNDEIGLPRLENILQKHPKLVFLGHSQAFWAEIDGGVKQSERGNYPKTPISSEGAIFRLMRKYTNLHGDLSAGSGFNAISRDREMGIKFLNEFQNKLYFGTDITSKDQNIQIIPYLNELHENGWLNDKAFDKITWKNAANLLNLQDIQ